MKLVFRDQTFSFELLRAIGYTVYDGTDIGECLATAARIKEGDFESWHTEWTRTAQRVQKIADLSKLKEYTLEGCVKQIACPTLVLAGEKDHFYPGQPEQLYEHLSCPKTFICFTTEEGAEEHVQAGAMTLFHQRLFDWLDETWARKN